MQAVAPETQYWFKSLRVSGCTICKYSSFNEVCSKYSIIFCRVTAGESLLAQDLPLFNTCDITTAFSSSCSLNLKFLLLMANPLGSLFVSTVTISTGSLSCLFISFTTATCWKSFFQNKLSLVVLF